MAADASVLSVPSELLSQEENDLVVTILGYKKQVWIIRVRWFNVIAQYTALRRLYTEQSHVRGTDVPRHSGPCTMDKV